MSLNNLILGTVQLGMDYGINNTVGKPSINQGIKILDFAYANGVRYIDTAEAYGNSHEVIARFNNEKKYSDLKIITKYSGKQDLKSSFQKSLQDFGLKNIHSYFLHNINQFLQNNVLIDELIHLKKNGLIEKVGVSVYSLEEMEQLPLNKVDIVQIPFNILDNKKGELFNIAIKNNIELHFRSIFFQGLLFKPVEELKGNFKVFKKPMTILNQLCSEYQISIPELCIGYIFSMFPEGKIVVGVDTIEQLRNNITIFKNIKTLPLKIVEEINKMNYNYNNMLNPSNWNK